jgi:hypothetical protein
VRTDRQRGSVRFATLQLADTLSVKVDIENELLASLVVASVPGESTEPTKVRN